MTILNESPFAAIFKFIRLRFGRCNASSRICRLTVIAPDNSSSEVTQESHPRKQAGNDETCPVCGQDNQCRVAKGHLYKGLCWCEKIVVPGHILSRLANEWAEPACICRSCLETIARVSALLEDPDAVVAEVFRLTRPTGSMLLPEDYYLDENGNMVFTAAYHLERGTCCGNGCRNCPY
jgi:hypothetical protein